MIEPAIRVKNLGKVYNINHEQKASAGNATLIDVISGIAKKPIELLTGHRVDKEKFWALKDVNFEVNKGDVVGIIGRNGSGKSTLLKVLSRIVEPTTGEISMRGKVASLLEVGTGFHPELTGRENIFFNGAILGMSQKEIRSKFDEIVAFSGIDKFLDTPVKFYSSGMYVRLAFSVAAHLDPDILVVDEVLAVGDAEFQKKCLGKMQDVASHGRTVIFVSHDMSAVESLCKKAIYMESGKVVVMGTVAEAQDRYGAQQQVASKYDLTRARREGAGEVKATSVTLLDNKSNPVSSLNYAKEAKLEIVLSKNAGTIKDVQVDLNIFNIRNTHLAHFNNSQALRSIHKNKIIIDLPEIKLGPGVYSSNISILTDRGVLQDFIQDAFRFNVAASDINTTAGAGLFQEKFEIHDQ